MAVVALALAAGPVRAGWWCTSYCPPPVCVTYVEKEVTCFRPVVREREVPCVVNRPVFHTETVKQTCTILVPEYHNEKRVVTYFRSVPREIECEALRCRAIPVTVCDPCTGCQYTTCRYETYVEKVKRTVLECVPEPREITVRVCSYRPQEMTYDVRRVVCEWKTETVVRKQYYCEMVPYQTTVRVPVCVPVCCQ
jgi:hypothetical protein